MTKKTFPVEVRMVETEYGETGVGQSNRVDTTYELGTEVDGAWVRFASVPNSTVEALVERAKNPAPEAEQGTTTV